MMYYLKFDSTSIIFPQIHASLLEAANGSLVGLLYSKTKFESTTYLIPPTSLLRKVKASKKLKKKNVLL